MSGTPEAHGDGASVGARVALVDPESFRVLWTNISSEPSRATAAVLEGPALEDALPMADQLGLRDAIHAAAGSGTPRHLRADVISTRRGAMALVVSVYPLPDGKVLVVAENAWRSNDRSPERRGR